MDKFTTLTGIAAPMPLVNIDTDMIIPKQFLKTIKRSGLGVNLFDEMRYTQDGAEIPDFVLNQPAYRKAEIIVAGDNFGCGSIARTCALGAAGFRHPLRDLDQLCRHLLQQLLQERHPADRAAAEQVDVLMDDATQGRQRPHDRRSGGADRHHVGRAGRFPSRWTPFRKHCLMNGLDDIGLTLEKAAAIDSFEKKAAALRPWV